MDPNTYRVERGRILMWLGGFVVFGFVGTGLSLMVIAPDVVEMRPVAGIGDSLFRWFMAGFGVAMWCLYAVLLVVELGGRLTVSRCRVEWSSVFRRRHVELGDVVDARWRGGSLCLRTPQENLAIDFSVYAARQRAELIRFFRFALSEDVQHGWERFWMGHWGLFDVADPNDPVILAERRALRRRFNIYCALGLVPMAAVFVWQWTSGLCEYDPLFWRHWLTLGVGWLILWGFVHLTMAPRKGESTGRIVPSGSRPIRKRYPPPSEDRDAWFFSGVFLALFALMIGRFALQWAGWPVAAEVVMWTGTVAVLMAFFPMMWFFGRRQEAWRREAARLAEQEYMTRPDGA